MLRALKALGFSDAARDVVYRNICNITYSFYVNGEVSGLVRSTWGLRQGDPLSLLLFVLAQQVFSIKLQHLIQLGKIISYKVGRDELPISHLLYADDVLLFTSGGTHEATSFL